MERPIIIIGAGRSGTKLLRSVISTMEETVAFPREINYIWRHGNIDYPTDELTPEQARPEVQHFIQQQFAQLSSRNAQRRVIEKTCANSLRVSFIYKIFPDALFVHTVRDGRSVAESARRRWRAKPEMKYLVEKVRWVPWQDIPYYGWRYMRYQMGRFGQNEGAQSSWGPRFAGLDQLVQEKTLLEVCAIQWQTCVLSADAALEDVPKIQVFTLRYEDLIAHPVEMAQEIATWGSLRLTTSGEKIVQKIVHPGNLNKWRSVLNEDELERLDSLIGGTLIQHGYEA